MFPNFNHNNQSDNVYILHLMNYAFNSLPDLVYIMQVQEQDLIYIYANRSGLTALGSELVIGKSLHDIIPRSRLDFLQNFYNRAAAFKKCVTFEEKVHINNKYINYETVLTPVETNGETYIIAIVRDITERTKRSEELIRSNYLLEKNKQQLSSLIENNSEAIFMLDLDGFFLEANGPTEVISGYVPFELLGTSILRILPKNEVKRVYALFNRAIDLGESLNYETKIIHKDGSEIFISIKTIPVKVAGKIIGTYNIARDITSEKKTIEELQLMKKQLESFLNYNTDSITIENLKGEIVFVNDAYSTTFGFTKGEVLNKLNPNVPEWLVEEDRYIHEQVIQGKDIKNIHMKRQKKSGEIMDISMTVFPIFNEEGSITGLSHISRNITELKNNERKMLNEKNELELVWNNSSDAIFLLSYDGTIIKANPAFKQLFAVDEDEDEDAESFNISKILLDYQSRQTEDFMARLRNSKKYLQFETKRKQKDGAVIDVLATYEPVDNKDILAIGTYKDITAEKRAMAKLKESEQKYRKVVEHSPDALVIHDGQVITFINDAGVKLARATSADQIIGQALLDFVHPDYREAVIKRIKNAVQHGIGSGLLEEVYYSLDKEKLYVESASAPIMENGTTSVIVMIRDVTKRRRAEMNLKESEERFRIIAEQSRSVIKMINLEGKVFYASPSAEETLGYSISDLIGSSFFDNIHQEELKKVEDTIQTVIRTCTSVEIEIRHIHMEGCSIWLNSYFTPVFSSDGEVEKIIVISDDITAAKRKMSKLKRLAYYDHLTGLPNRRLLNERLDQALLTSKKTGNITGLLVLDCDKFKQINDTLGHDTGDKVIKEFANRVKSALWKKDTLSRIGGDEFTIVLPELKNLEELDFICEKILNAIKEPMLFQENVIRITASIGGSIYPSTTSAEALFKKADLNLYESKKLGGNTYTNS